MIWESEPWKRALRSDLKRLDRLRCHGGSESKLAAIERIMFTAGFSIRRLMEANKLTDRISKSQIKAERFPFSGNNTPDHLNWHHLDRFFDLENVEEGTLSLRRFCNMFVHSFIFVIDNDEESSNMVGIFITTDLEKDKYLYRIEYSDIQNIILAASKDSVVRTEAKRQADGQWKFRNFGPQDG